MMFLSNVLTGAATGWLLGQLNRATARLMVVLRGSSAPAASARSPWLAGGTYRWHTNPVFAGTADRIDGHSARVAILILQFRPDASRELLRAAVTHDLGEHAVGDIAGPVKRRNPDLYAEIARLEVAELCAMGLDVPSLTDDEAALLRLCDGLDAYLWAVHHAPGYVERRKDWRAMFKALRAAARALGYRPAFDLIVAEVRHGQS